MRYLTLPELIDLHRRLIVDTGGGEGVRDLHGLESATAQPRASFGGQELYPTLTEKAAAICYSLALKREQFTQWVREHITDLPDNPFGNSGIE